MKPNLRFHISHLAATVAIVAVFLALRSQWIVCEDDAITGYTPLVVASLTGIYAGWCQSSRMTILASSILAGLVTSTSFALEMVFHSPASNFYRDRISEMYYDNPEMKTISVLISTILAGILGMMFGWAFLRLRTWIIVNRTELFMIGIGALASFALAMTVHEIGMVDFVDGGRFIFGSVALGSILAVAWVFTFRSFPRSPRNAG